MARFVFPVRSLHYVALTDPITAGPMDSSPAFYSVAFPVDDLPEALADLVPLAVNRVRNGKSRLFSARTRLRPVLADHTKDRSDLRDLRMKCEDANINFQKLLRGVPAEIAVTTYDIRNPGDNFNPIDPVGIGLEAVRFDAGSIKVPGWDDIIGEPI